MFGNIRRRREKKRKKKEAEFNKGFSDANREAEIANPVQEYQTSQSQAAQAAQPGLDDLNKKREEHLAQSVREVSTDVPGLTDLQRKQLQESASNQINKDYQNYSRQLASSAGARGVRGGSAAAQQMALQDKALDARRQFERDIGEKDIDIAMSKLAAALASTESKQAQEIGAQAEARDWIEAEKERRRQQALASFYNNHYIK